MRGRGALVGYPCQYHNGDPALNPRELIRFLKGIHASASSSTSMRLMGSTRIQASMRIKAGGSMQAGGSTQARARL